MQCGLLYSIFMVLNLCGCHYPDFRYANSIAVHSPLLASKCFYTSLRYHALLFVSDLLALLPLRITDVQTGLFSAIHCLLLRTGPNASMHLCRCNESSRLVAKYLLNVAHSPVFSRSTNLESKLIELFVFVNF